MNVDNCCHLTPLALALDHGSYGGKAANLARLARCSVLTSPGCALGARELDDQLERCGLGSVAENIARLRALPPAQARERARELRMRVVDAPLAQTLVSDLHVYCATLPPGARLAVRSSAVGEDSAAASFAGMFETCLDVRGVEMALTAIRRVWASLFGARALAYAMQRQVFPAGMGVVVQLQVDARHSGVLFTRDPRPRGRRADVLLEYCSGLGERLVSGAITPTTLLVRETGEIVTISTGDEGASLAGSAVRDLTAIGRELERHFGAPQDVEWSIDTQGSVVILQARPITTQALSEPESVAEPAAAPAQLWSNANIAENYPGPICPLLESFVARGYAEYFRGLGVAFGVSPRRLAAMNDQLSNLVATHAGRLYYNLSHIHAALCLLPGGLTLARFFNQFIGSSEFPEPAALRTSWLERWREAARVAVCVPYQYARVERRIARFEGAIDAFARSTSPEHLATASRLELAARLRAFLSIRLEQWTDAALADTAAMVCYGLLQFLLERWLPDGASGQLQNDLLKGLPGLASAIPVEKLWDLSRQVRADAALLALFRERSPEAVVAALEGVEHAAFRRELESYLRDWGYRYSGELMLTQVTPQEDRVPVVRLLQRYVADEGQGPAALSAAQTRARLVETARVERILTPSPSLRRLKLGRATVFGALLRATHGSIRLRERARSKQALLYVRLRGVALRAGSLLSRSGKLAQRDDVFLLTMDELLGLLEGSAGQAPDLRGEIGARKAAAEGHQAQEPPDHFRLPRGAVWQGAGAIAQGTPAEDGALAGNGACGGIVEGPAVVVLDVANADRVHSGQILVARQTDPGWASVFFLISGLVIERGGMLSHGAIIAREYGIPAVVGVRHATRLITDGERVVVDGCSGKVTRHVV